MIAYQKLVDFYREHHQLLTNHYPGLTEGFFLGELSRTMPECLTSCFQDLIKGVPLQYITGRSYFYRSEFLVNQHVLIPRSETELLVDFAKDKIFSGGRILDLGTGSGNIIISLLQCLDFPVTAIGSDISDEALSLAKKNSFRMGLSYHPETKLDFVLSDRFDFCHDEMPLFDLIVSNPPYIKLDADSNEVHQQVRQFEPSMALYLNDDNYLTWYRELFKSAWKKLNKQCYFVMEGHENHLQELAKEARQLNFFVEEIMQDLTGRDRFLIMKKV